MHRIFVIASFQKCHRGGSVRTRTRLGGRIGSIVQVTVSALFKKKWLSRGSVRVKIPHRESDRVRTPPRGSGSVRRNPGGAFSFLCTFVPGSEKSTERNFAPVELSFRGTFAPWNFRSCGTFVPPERTFQELSLL